MSFGDDNAAGTRQIVTNLKSKFTADAFVGRQVVCLNNIKKSKFAGVTSEAMVWKQIMYHSLKHLLHSSYHNLNHELDHETQKQIMYRFFRLWWPRRMRGFRF